MPKINNNEGIVLVTVIAIVLGLMILAVTLMSTNASQFSSHESQINRIKAEQLAKGAFWFNYMSLLNTNSTSTIPTEVLDGKSYSAVIVNSAGGGPNATDLYNITVTYPR